MSAEASPGPDQKLDLLRRAYRVLKHEFEERERSLAAERAAHASTIAERAALTTRAEAAEKQVRELKQLMSKRVQAANAIVSRTNSNAVRDPAQATSTDEDNADAGSGMLSSYERGMEWADRIMSHATIFSAALTTSLESVSSLTVPAAVQAQLDRQEEMIEAQTHLLQASLAQQAENVPHAHPSCRIAHVQSLACASSR
jgi:hypothetical protein